MDKQGKEARIPLREFAVELLDFIQEKLREAMNEPQSREAALIEADSGLRVLRSRLRAEDEYRLTQFVLVFESDLMSLQSLEGAQFSEEVGVALERLRVASEIVFKVH